MTKVNSVNVSPVALTMATGDWYYDASASVCPQNADCKEVTWHSDDTSVATVNPSTGYICAQGEGTAKIYATATDGSGCSDYISLTVKNFIPINMIAIADQDIRVEKDTTRHLSIGISPENATNKAVTWSSSNTGVATVEDGVIYGVSTGKARICVEPSDGGGGDGDCRMIEVTEDILVKSITVSPSSKVMRIGDSLILSATVCPQNATNRGITWHSTNPKVVTVNKDSGLVCAVGIGSACIYAKSTDGGDVRCYCSVAVRKVPVASITITPSSKSMAIGSTATLTATISPENATNKTVVWSVNPEDQHVITVTPNTGRVTAHSAGEKNVWAHAQDGSGEYMNCRIKVGTPVSKITINPSSRTMVVGSTITLTATVTPGNAINKTILWSVNPEDQHIITVDPNTGRVTAHSTGEANVWAHSQDGSGEYMNCLITVINPSWEELGFSYDGSTRDFVRLNNDLPPYAYESWLTTDYGYSDDPFLDTITVNFDAIYVVDYSDLPFFGHAYLLLKKNDGTWIKTQFSGDFPEFNSNFIEFLSEIQEKKKNATISSEGIINTKIVEKLSAKLITITGKVVTTDSTEQILSYYSSGVQFVPLKGNFSNSIEGALSQTNTNYNGYNVLTNNCLHYVRNILRLGEANMPAAEQYITESSVIVPKTFYDELKSVTS